VRAGYGAGVAAMLQTVAIVGPVRYPAPLTQAMGAPLVGAVHARGGRPAELFAVRLAIRLVNYAVITALALSRAAGAEGLGRKRRGAARMVPLLPNGLAGGLILTVITEFVFAVSVSVVQV
jgi:hypothetical protein